jgi:hypothetical protein
VGASKFSLALRVVKESTKPNKTQGSSYLSMEEIKKIKNDPNEVFRI